MEELAVQKAQQEDVPVEKLIRDKLVELIPSAELRQETDHARLGLLLECKLDEEIKELRESRYSDAAEYADVIEVLYALAGRAGLSASDIEKARLEKLSRRGGFHNGLVWRGESTVVK